MNDRRQQNLQDVLVFAMVVAIGVAGRWGQPLWAFTPTAAAAVFAGFYFSRLAVAAMVPVSILAISDLILPPHNNLGVLIVTYVAMIAPVYFGRLLRGENRIGATAAKMMLCGLVPATVFFLTSNFAVWAFQSNYEKSLAGLMECYAAAVPFYRWMLAGDIFYMAVLLGCWIGATIGVVRDRPSALVVPVIEKKS